MSVSIGHGAFLDPVLQRHYSVWREFERQLWEAMQRADSETVPFESVLQQVERQGVTDEQLREFFIPRLLVYLEQSHLDVIYRLCLVLRSLPKWAYLVENCLEVEGKGYLSLLQYAVLLNNKKAVKLFVEKLKVRTDIGGSEGTALHLAVSHQRPLLISILAQSDQDFAFVHGHYTPLQHAILSKQLMAALEIVRKAPKCLAEHVSVSFLPGSNAVIPPQANALHLAAICGFDEWISALPRINHLEAKTAGTDVPDTRIVNRRGPNQATALHLAAYHGHFKAATALLQRGANAQAMCGHGYTALDYLLLGLQHKIVTHSSKEDIQAFFAMLKEKGVDFEESDEDDNNFLHEFITCPMSSSLRKTFCEAIPGYQKMLKQKNAEGKTPFFLCAFYDLELFKIFMPLCPELINAKGDQGRTIVHYAVKRDKRDLLQYLATVEECDPNIRDDLEETPLHIAMRKGKADMIARLRAFDRLNTDLPLGNRKRRLAERDIDEDDDWQQNIRELASETYHSAGSEYSDSFDEMLRSYYEDDLHEMAKKNSVQGIRDPNKNVPPLVQAARDNQPGMLGQLALDGRTDLEARDPKGKKAANYAKRTLIETKDKTLITILNQALKARSKGTTTGATSDPDSDQDPRLQQLEKRVRLDRTLRPPAPVINPQRPRLIALFRGINFKQHLPPFQNMESRLAFAFKDESGQTLFAYGVHDLLQESPIEYSKEINAQRMKLAEMVREEVRLSFASAPVREKKETWNSAGLRNLQAYVNQYDNLQTVAHTVAIADKILRQAKEHLPDLAGRLPGKLVKGFKMYISFSDGARTACRFSVALGSAPSEKASALDLHSRPNGKSKKRAIGKVYVVIATPEQLGAMNAQNVLAHQKARQIHLKSLYVYAREIAIPAYVSGEAVALTQPIVMPTFNKEWKEKYQDLYGLDKTQYDKLKPQFSPQSRSQPDYQKNKKRLLERLVDHATTTLEGRVNQLIQCLGGQRVYWGHHLGFQENPPAVDIHLSSAASKEGDPETQSSCQEKRN
ncbi:MAG: ankyrin repeat domain-containing protein [Parachlamydia sp.]|nr:ankyrin repeat domain-containing protein [Parachlamydia sp.]